MTVDSGTTARNPAIFTVSTVNITPNGTVTPNELRKANRKETIVLDKIKIKNLNKPTEPLYETGFNGDIRLHLDEEPKVNDCAINREDDLDDSQTSEDEYRMESNTDDEPITKSKEKCGQTCVKNCHKCCIRVRLPPWFRQTLQFIYRWTGDPMTYIILFVLVYMTISSLQPDMAQLPECRRIIIPTTSLSPGQISNDTGLFSIAEVNVTIPNDYTIGLECRHGDAFSVLVMYAFGFYVGQIMELIHLPGLIGMILGGMTLRNIGAAIAPHHIYHVGATPNASVTLAEFAGFQGEAPFDATDGIIRFSALLSVNPNLSAVLRQLVLATILTRAGLGINPTTLKRVYGSVLRLTFIPCLTEAAVLTVVSHFLIGWPWVWGAVLGFVIAAVSPSVVVPIMMRLEASGWGVAAGIPTLIVAASSLDDVLAITGFSVCLAVALSTGTNLVTTIFWGPGQALIGVVFGAAVGSVLGLYPPARLEHSHTIRFMFVACIAAIGLIGSMRVQLPGAGALACLVSAFTIATIWRAGFPWKFLPIGDRDEPSSAQACTEVSNIESAGANEPGFGGAKDTETFSSRTFHNRNNESKPGQHAYILSDESLSDEETDLNNANLNRTIPSNNRRIIRHRQRFHRDSTSSNTLETVVEYHPYNRSTVTPIKEIKPIRLHAISHQNDSVQSNVNENLNASPMAASVDVYGQPDVTSVLPRSASSRSRPRRFRRFSLQEPTAPYDLESFTMTGSFRAILANKSAAFCEGKALVVRRSIGNDRQPDPASNRPPDALEQSNYGYAMQQNRIANISGNVPQSDIENGECVTNKASTSKLPKSSVHQIPHGDFVMWAATSKERGEACLNLIRQTFSSVWWFVQPVLFSLIGAELNLTIIKGSFVGLGIASLVIGIVLRMLASVVAVWPAKLNVKERVFISFSWLPKATVQAAIGSVALDTARQLNASTEIIGYAELVLILAATAILMTAPVGAVLMRVTAPYLLVQDTTVLNKNPNDKTEGKVVTNGKLNEGNMVNLAEEHIQKTEEIHHSGMKTN